MSGRLDGIQILRFVAAAMVLIQHAVYMPSIQFGIDLKPFFRLQLGAGGVYIFFVISGFVIAGLIDQRPLKFALHRIARIYPPYIIATAIAAIVMISIGAVAPEKVRWVWSYTLLPTGSTIDSWSQVPFWTLIYEMTYYGVALALMFGGRRAFDVGLVFWATAIVVTAYFLPAPKVFTANLLAILTNPISLLFIAGAALGRALNGSTWPLATIGVVAVTGFWRSGSPYQSVPVFAIGTLGLIYLAVFFNDALLRQRWLKPLVRGGDYSYGLYLAHAPIIWALVVLGIGKLGYPAACAICLVVGLSAGLAYGWFDHLLYRRLSKPLADRLSSAYLDYAYKPPVAAEPAESPGR